ncbi:protein unc-93 homolog A isoform X4 [Callithrix jacchus]
MDGSGGKDEVNNSGREKATRSPAQSGILILTPWPEGPLGKGVQRFYSQLLNGETESGGLQGVDLTSSQSSLYSEEGLGVTALSTLYGGMLLSSMFLPPLLIQRLGCKGTILLSMCGYVAFSMGNFFASWYTLIPTSILLGLGAAPLWSAQCTYLTIMGKTRAEKAGKRGQDGVTQCFGIFFLIFQSSGVWGNLISSLVLGQTPSQETLPEEQLSSCGASDCLMATATTNSTQRPSQQLVYTLLGIYTGSGVLAVLMVAAFLEPARDVQHQRGGEKKSPPFWSTLLSTFRLYRDKRLCLLILLPLYSGLQQGFLSGEYTRSYVTCALGIQFVGYVMICFSAADALCSVLCGKVSQYAGRVALYVLGLWGVADAVWQTQNNGIKKQLKEINQIGWAWWLTPVIPATREAEARESLEPGRRRFCRAGIAPLHSSLSNKSETQKKKKRKKERKENMWATLLPNE